MSQFEINATIIAIAVCGVVSLVGGTWFLLSGEQHVLARIFVFVVAVGYSVIAAKCVRDLKKDEEKKT